jgi:hypothetical protein
MQIGCLTQPQVLRITLLISSFQVFRPMASLYNFQFVTTTNKTLHFKCKGGLLMLTFDLFDDAWTADFRRLTSVQNFLAQGTKAL